MSDKKYEPVREYEAVGPLYRFFATWRHAAFVGNLVILWGVGSLLASAYQNSAPLAAVIPLLASIASVSLWIADKRTRQIYRALVESGKELEGDAPGPYHALSDIAIPQGAPWFPKNGKDYCKLFSQSTALSGFFLGSAFILLGVACYTFCYPPNASINQLSDSASNQAINTVQQ